MQDPSYLSTYLNNLVLDHSEDVVRVCVIAGCIGLAQLVPNIGLEKSVCARV